MVMSVIAKMGNLNGGIMLGLEQLNQEDFKDAEDPMIETKFRTEDSQATGLDGRFLIAGENERD